MKSKTILGIVTVTLLVAAAFVGAGAAVEVTDANELAYYINGGITGPATADGDTVTLNEDVECDGFDVAKSATIVLDLNDHAMILLGATGSSGTVSQGIRILGDSTTKGNLTIKNGTITIGDVDTDTGAFDSDVCELVHAQGDLTLDDVTLDCTAVMKTGFCKRVTSTGLTQPGAIALHVDQGNVSIKNSIINARDSSYAAITVANTSSEIYTTPNVTIADSTVFGVITVMGDDITKVPMHTESGYTDYYEISKGVYNSSLYPYSVINPILTIKSGNFNALFNALNVYGNVEVDDATISGTGSEVDENGESVITVNGDNAILTMHRGTVTDLVNKRYGVYCKNGGTAVLGDVGAENTLLQIDTEYSKMGLNNTTGAGNFVVNSGTYTTTKLYSFGAYSGGSITINGGVFGGSIGDILIPYASTICSDFTVDIKGGEFSKKKIVITEQTGTGSGLASVIIKDGVDVNVVTSETDQEPEKEGYPTFEVALKYVKKGTILPDSNLILSSNITIAQGVTVTVPKDITLKTGDNAIDISGELEVAGTLIGKINSLSANTLIIKETGKADVTFPDLSAINAGIILEASGDNNAVLIISKDDTAGVDDVLALVKKAAAGTKVVKETENQDAAVGKEFSAEYDSSSSDPSKTVQQTKYVIVIPENDNNKTVVGVTADTKYEVTIPAQVALTTKDAPVTANYKINVTTADPSSTQKIVMKLTGKEVDSDKDAQFNVLRVGGTEKLPYTIKNGESSISINSEIVSNGVAVPGEKTTTLTYTLTANPTSAGTYKDTLTFTVGLE